MIFIVDAYELCIFIYPKCMIIYFQSEMDETVEREQDHLLFSLLSLLIKILRDCDIIRKPQWAPKLRDVWGEHYFIFVHQL